MNQRTFDDFDEFASDYRTIHTRNIQMSGADSFYFAEMKVKLLRAYEQNTPLQIVDIGCGDGATEFFMDKHFSKWMVKGLDISTKSIAAARQKALPNANFIIYNGTQIPLAEESADIVFMAGVLHHVDYIYHQIILMEICRILKKGGRLYFFEHNPLNPLTRYLVNTCEFDKNAKMLKSKYTLNLLQQNNFKINKIQFIIFFPRTPLFSKLLFLEKYFGWIPLGGQYLIKAHK